MKLNMCNRICLSKYKAKKSRHPALFLVFLFSHLLFIALIIYGHGNSVFYHGNWLYYHENSHPVSVIIQPVSMFVYGFCLRVSTFA